MLYNKLVEKQVFDVLIFGGGPSGLTAAIYTSRAGLSTKVLAGNPPGGQLMWTTEVENFPGFPDGIMGPDLIATFRKQAQKFGVEFSDENVVSLSGDFRSNFKAITDFNNTFQGRSVIIATGASAKWLGLDSEKKFIGRGVSACATCDAFFFKDKVVAVVGGGDAALEEALYLAKFASKVYVLVRGSQENLRASKIMQTRAFKNLKLEFRFNLEVLEVLGESKVSGLKVKNNQTQEDLVMDDVQGLFVAIGHTPNTAFLSGEDNVNGLIELGKFGYALPSPGTQTHTITKGLFVAGDVSDHRYRQAITAAGFGCMAALDVEKFLSEENSS